ncbi:MAG: hypothetical protein ABI628_08290 [Chloroflexota bacterium]
MHRRPLGRGRLLATIGALIVLAGCVLPWYSATAGNTGLTPVTTNAFSDKGIVVFICALVVLALVSLPYAAGDKPLAVDRALSYVIVVLLAIGAFAWRTLDFVLIDATGLRPDLAPGLWISAVGLVFLARATYEINAEHRL